jgi:ABC-2 type transport system ATP-binding protein
VNANIIKNEILFLREKGATIIFSTHNMESVETLCDNITLIDKSKNILEGGVNEIRSKWAANEYDLIIEGDAILENNALYNIVNKSFECGKSLIKIKTFGSVNTNDILYDVMKQGNVLSFTQALPSMNEIFLRVVQSRN